MLKRWNAALIILTFLLVIEGTFLTRSGVISSVHTFAQSAIGPLFLGFLAIMFVFSLYVFVTRWDILKSENELDSLFSRESVFLLNNLVFIGLAVVVWWGTHFPLFSEAIIGEKIVVGPPFFEQSTAPLWAIIVLLMGIAPLVPWRRASLKKTGRLPAVARRVWSGSYCRVVFFHWHSATVGLGRLLDLRLHAGCYRAGILARGSCPSQKPKRKLPRRFVAAGRTQPQALRWLLYPHWGGANRHWGGWQPLLSS